jgi:hypothetical protein
MKRKTSVYLDEAQVEELKRLAEYEGRSQAGVLRDAILLYAQQLRRPRRFACAAIAKGPGGSVADIPEEELLQGFGE